MNGKKKNKNECIGTYVHCPDVTMDGGNNVWKLKGRSHYIFNTGCGRGWRIGKRSDWTDGSFHFKSSF